MAERLLDLAMNFGPLLPLAKIEGILPLSLRKIGRSLLVLWLFVRFLIPKVVPHITRTAVISSADHALYEALYNCQLGRNVLHSATTEALSLQYLSSSNTQHTLDFSNLSKVILRRMYRYRILFHASNLFLMKHCQKDTEEISLKTIHLTCFGLSEVPLEDFLHRALGEERKRISERAQVLPPHYGSWFPLI